MTHGEGWLRGSPADSDRPGSRSMKIAIISDIHGNLEALEAVAGELERLDLHRALLLGAR